MTTAFEDAVRVLFQDPHLFPETITYKPQGGAPRAIKARVDRGNQVDVLSLGGQPMPANTVRLSIAHHATLGISSVKERFDKVDLKLKLSDAAVTEVTIMKLLKHDEMCWVVEATK